MCEMLSYLGCPKENQSYDTLHTADRCYGTRMMAGSLHGGMYVFVAVDKRKQIRNHHF